jgi:hypothetical protein
MNISGLLASGCGPCCPRENKEIDYVIQQSEITDIVRLLKACLAEGISGRLEVTNNERALAEVLEESRLEVAVRDIHNNGNLFGRKVCERSEVNDIRSIFGDVLALI